MTKTKFEVFLKENLRYPKDKGKLRKFEKIMKKYNKYFLKIGEKLKEICEVFLKYTRNI